MGAHQAVTRGFPPAEDQNVQQSKGGAQFPFRSGTCPTKKQGAISLACSEEEGRKKKGML